MINLIVLITSCLFIFFLYKSWLKSRWLDVVLELYSFIDRDNIKLMYCDSDIHFYLFFDNERTVTPIHKSEPGLKEGVMLNLEEFRTVGASSSAAQDGSNTMHHGPRPRLEKRLGRQQTTSVHFPWRRPRERDVDGDGAEVLKTWKRMAAELTKKKGIFY
jgi:hypothetical protein